MAKDWDKYLAEDKSSKDKKSKKDWSKYAIEADEMSNILPEGMQESIDWGNKKTIPKILDVVGDVIGKPKKALEQKLRGQGFAGTPTTDKETLAKLRYENPYLYPIASVTAKSPRISDFIKRQGMSAKNIVKDINEGWLPSAAGGFLQTTANAPISVANAVLERTNLGTIPYVNLEQYKPSDSFSSNIGFKGGQIGGYLAPYSAVSKVLSSARPATGIGGLASDVLSGGATGYLLGGEEGDVGRYLGAGLGAISEPLQSVGASKIATRLVDRADALRKTFNKRYSGIFSQAEKDGIKTISIPNAPYDKVSLFTKGKYGKSMSQFRQNPTPENAHRLQSDLGKFVSQLEKRVNTTGLSSQEIGQLTKALEIQKRIRGSLFKDLNKSKGLGDKYQKVTQDYSKEMIPYKNKAIREYVKGERNAEDLIKYLNNSIRGRAQIKPKHPEITANQVLKKLYPWVLGGTGIFGAGKYLSNQFGGLLHNDE